MQTPENISEYLAKILELEREREEGLPPKEDLEQIAIELGIDWEAVEQLTNTHLTNGRAHLEHEHWEAAAEAFEQAVTLQPYHQQAHLGLAEALLQDALRSRAPKQVRAAEAQASRALQLVPGDSRVIELLAQLNRKVVPAGNSEFRWIWALLPICLVIVLGFYFLMPEDSAATSEHSTTNHSNNSQEKTPLEQLTQQQKQYNEVIALKEKALAQWAQVENVYQRRADLIPQVVTVVNASKKFNTTTIQELKILYKDAMVASVGAENPARFQQYQTIQQKVGLALSEISEAIKDQQEDSFVNLQAQIEGAENRISIERKKYNEAVRPYNTKIQQAPYNELQFQPLPYFRMQSGADQAPKINIK